MRFATLPFLAALACALACAPPPCADDARAAAIDCAERVPVDGARLYLVLRGRDRHAPVLVWLHGGPGGTEIPFFRLFDAGLERRFVAAYYDQRGAGRSFDPQADPKQLTVARHLADLDAIVDHVRARLGAERVVLIGHSWGSELGLLYARDHPDKVAAFVGVNQVTASRAQQESEYAFVAAEAARRGDQDALEALRALGPPPYGARAALELERWSGRYGGIVHHGPSRALTALRAMLAGYARPWEIASFVRANETSLDAMSAELLALDLRREVPRVDVPVFFLLGRHDRHVDARLAAAYFDALAAPRKELMWFEDSAHNVPFEEPKRFQATVTRIVEGVTGGSVTRPAGSAKATRPGPAGVGAPIG